MTHCGVSGWTHPDWSGVVYPALKPRGFHPLEHLAQTLDFVEIDCSFDRPIRPELTKLWLRKTPETFRFTVQVGRPFTTEGVLCPADLEAFKEGLWPLLHSGRLGCLLLRFPWSFRFSKENREQLIEVRKAFHEFPMVAELRHSSWSLDEAIGTLMDYRVGFCNVDQPEDGRAMPPRSYATSDVGYVRLFGREGEPWFAEEKSRDYLYKPPELGLWKARIDRMSSYTKDIYVSFANATAGKAVVNALQMRALVTDPTAVPKRRSDRTTLEMPRRSPGAPIVRTALRQLA
ncbi:MAG: DUF72 domain-containing protein [Bryobacteraceae bacterium]